MPHESAETFQLLPQRWYAWQVLPGYRDGPQPYYSPIYLTHMTPKHSGSMLLLDFFNVLYLDGSQHFHLKLQMIRNNRNYLIGDVLDTAGAQQRVAIISPISFGWLNQHCRHIVDQHPPELFGRSAEKHVATYLDRAFPYVQARN